LCADHASFQENKGPFPPHCVQGTQGSEFVDEIAQALEYALIHNHAKTFIVFKGMHECQDSFSAFPYKHKPFPLLKHIVRRGITSPMSGISSWKLPDESTMDSSDDVSDSDNSSISSTTSSCSSDCEMSDGDDSNSDDSKGDSSSDDDENYDQVAADYPRSMLGCTGCSAAPWTGAVALKTSGMIEVSRHMATQEQTYVINVNAPPDVLPMMPDNLERKITTMQEIVEQNMGQNGTIYVCGLAMDFCGKFYFLNCPHVY